MQLEKIEYGMRVKTHKRLGTTQGFFIAQKYLDARRSNKKGTISGWVSGHGGDVLWVAHEDGTTGAYMFNEFSPA